MLQTLQFELFPPPPPNPQSFCAWRGVNLVIRPLAIHISINCLLFFFFLNFISFSLSHSDKSTGIYIYIYMQRPHMGMYEVLPSGAFFAKRIEIFSSATSKIRTN